MAVRIKIGSGETRNVEDLRLISGQGVSVRGAAGVGTDDLDLTLGDARQGVSWYVNAAATGGGSDTNDGRSWEGAFLTMSKAFTSLASGDTVYFHGKVREQLTSPAQKFDVTVVGVGNRPRHIDGTIKAGSESAAMWTTPSSAAATTPLVKVQQQGWRFVNILFAGPTDAASILLFRDAGAGDDERDGSHTEVINCRFASGQDGIEQSGGCHHNGIYDCTFESLTGFAIKNTTGAGQGYPINWVVENNRFMDNANVLKMPCTNWRVRFNSFFNTTTEVFDTDAGDATAGKNIVVGNYFNVAAADFDPVGNVEGNTTDVWSNTLADVIETGIPAN